MPTTAEDAYDTVTNRFIEEWNAKTPGYYSTPGAAAEAEVTVAELAAGVVYGFAVASLAGSNLGAISGPLGPLTVLGVLATNSISDTFTIYFDGDVRDDLVGHTITCAGVTWGPLSLSDMQFTSGRTVVPKAISDPADLWDAADIGDVFTMSIDISAAVPAPAPELRFYGNEQPGIPKAHFARFKMQNVLEGQRTLRSGDEDDNRYQTAGVIFVQVFAPRDRKTALEECRKLATVARDIFRGKTFDGGIVFRAVRVVDVEDNPKDNFLQKNVVMEFEYDEIG